MDSVSFERGKWKEEGRMPVKEMLVNPSTLNFQPDTRNPKPETRNPKPGT